MTDQEAGQYWNDNAEAWTVLARSGFDIYRDHLNTPAFFEILPGINGLTGIDIGCGEGHNTRLLAQKGANIKAVDISQVFITKAMEISQQTDPVIEYKVASATALPFESCYFDFATAFMCLMDIPAPSKALQEINRVLKPGGFLQFSITHPCFATPHRKNLRDANGRTYAIEVGNYFDKPEGRIDRWTFGAAPADLKCKYPEFQVPVFNHTLSQWINMVIDAGFIIEQLNEPNPDDETISKYPALQDARLVAYFLHIRCRKSHTGISSS